jgi:hypothetical protein
MSWDKTTLAWTPVHRNGTPKGGLTASAYPTLLSAVSTMLLACCSLCRNHRFVAVRALQLLQQTASLAVLLSSCELATANGGDVDGGGGAGAIEGSGAGGGETPSPCGQVPAKTSFEVGTGEVCFESVRSGQVVPRVAGPQGGIHLWAAILCEDCPSELRVSVAARGPDGVPFASAGERVVTLHSNQAAGFYALLADGVELPPNASEGAPAEIYVEARDLDGLLLHSGVTPVTLGPLVPWLNQCDPDPMSCGQPQALKCCN